MDIRFVGDEGSETRTTLVAKYNEEDQAADSDEPLIGTITASSKQKTKDQQTSQFLRLFARQLARMFVNVGGEFVGTFLLTFVICSVVAASIVTSAHVGLWQVAIVCGLGVSVSIYCTAHVSDAHLNPAITLAFAIVRWKSFSWKRIIPYIVAQLLGGIAAGGVMYALYKNAIEQFEEDYDITRGENNSEITAMLFGEYFPNPAFYNHTIKENLKVISPLGAMLVEALTTGILAFVIFCLTDQENSTVGSGKNKVIVPTLIGLTVTILISIYAPLTQVGMNPARDFGPRIFAACVGWGRLAVPGPRNGFWVYIVGPIIGAPIGAALYDYLVAVAVRLAKLKDKSPKKDES